LYIVLVNVNHKNQIRIIKYFSKIITYFSNIIIQHSTSNQKCHSQVLKLQKTASLRAAFSSKKETKVKKSNGQSQQSVNIPTISEKYGSKYG